MRQMKRRWAIGTAIVTVTAGAIAPVVTAQGAEPTKITLFQQRAQPFFEAAIKKFEAANPSIEVEVIVNPNQSSSSSYLLTGFRAGNAPDVIGGGCGSGTPVSTKTLAQAKFIEPLQKQPYAKSVPAQFAKICSIKDSLYALPLAANPESVVYNKEIFRSVGVKPPTTWAQFLTVCRKIKAAGKVPFAWTGAPATQNVFPGSVLLAAFGGIDQKFASEYRIGKASFAKSKKARRGLNAINEMRSAGCFQDRPEGTTIQSVFALMGTGQAAMYFQFPGVGFNRPILQVNPNLQLGAFAIPADKAADTRVPLLSIDSLMVNAASKNKAAAMKFVAFFSERAQAALYEQVNGGISMYNFARKRIPSTMDETRALIKAGKTTLDPRLVWPDPRYDNVVGPNIQGLFLGKSVSSVLQEFDRDMPPVNR